MNGRRRVFLVAHAAVAAMALSGAVTQPGLMAAQAAPASAQPRAKSEATRAWTPPKMPDGQYDLQGIWVSRTATPLERPTVLEGRTRLTDAEVAELKRRAERVFKSGDSDFAAGDAFFLAAWEDRQTFKSVTSTHGSEEMTERDFDHNTSLITDPPDGRVPPLTPAGQRRREAAAAAGRRPSGPESLNNALRCIAWGVPRLGGRYGAGDYGFYQIVQTPGYVVLYPEIGHDARIIPLDGRPHPSSRMRFWNGDSRGRWEGKTLVVDTTNFSETSNFMGAAEGLHLIERFTRVSPDTILYQMTLNDPATWTRPWSAEMPLRQSSEQLFEYACHEGNSAIIEGMLKAARADEREGR